MIPPATDVQLLKKTFILQDLSDPEVDQVLAATTPRQFAAGDTIMAENEPGDVMYFMCDGEVAIIKRLVLQVSEDAPKEKVMTRLKAQDGIIFGEMALIEDDVRSATVSAVSPCRLLELSKDSFFQLVHANPAMGVKILLRLSQIFSQRLRKSGDDIIKLTTALAIALER